MSNSVQYYPTFLDLNQTAFTQELFLVSYHSLCGALYCAFDLQDKAKVLEVQKIATTQLQQIQDQLDAQNSASEPLEVTLYTSLTRIAHPTHMVGFQSRVPQF